MPVVRSHGKVEDLVATDLLLQSGHKELDELLAILARRQVSGDLWPGILHYLRDNALKSVFDPLLLQQLSYGGFLCGIEVCSVHITALPDFDGLGSR